MRLICDNCIEDLEKMSHKNRMSHIRANNNE